MNCDLPMEELKESLQIEFMSDDETCDESVGADKVLIVHKPTYRSRMVSATNGYIKK